MILVTGGTGFIGQALIRQLVAMGKPVRTLLRPSKNTPNLPRSVPIEVAVSSLNDEKGLRAAMKDVQVVFHLVSSERSGSRADLKGVDVDGTEALTRVCVQTGVDRIFYISHIGADRASGYPLLKAKALAEYAITQSQVDYTIFRPTVVFGPQDQFTTSLARYIRRTKFFTLMPGLGENLIQPLWINDLVTCLVIALEDDSTRNKIFTIGGDETFNLRQLIEIFLRIMRLRRKIVSVSPPIFRFLSLYFEQVSPGLVLPYYWLDYLSVDRTCPLDSLPKEFGIMPARLLQHLDYLNIF